MERLIIFILSLFPYVKSLKAENESLKADEIFVNKKYAKYKSLKAEVDTLEQKIQAQLSEQRSLESLKAENDSLEADLEKCRGRMLKAQRRATKNRDRYRDNALLWIEHNKIYDAGYLIGPDEVFASLETLAEN